MNTLNTVDFWHATQHLQQGHWVVLVQEEGHRVGKVFTSMKIYLYWNTCVEADFILIIHL